MSTLTSIAADHMQSECGITPDGFVDLRGKASVNDPALTRHRHVVVILEDGSEMWLDLGDENKDHNFADIRWFNPAGEMKGVGAFTIVNGRRQSFGKATVSVGTMPSYLHGWNTYKEDPLKGTDGKPVTGHKWNGGYCVTLLVDKNDEEAAAIKPSAGNG